MLRRGYATLPTHTNNAISTIYHEHTTSISEAIEQLIETSLAEAIRTHPNPRHAAIFAARHGITTTGSISIEGEQTFDTIARTFGCTRTRAMTMYHRAAAVIYQELSRDLAISLRTLMK